MKELSAPQIASTNTSFFTLSLGRLSTLFQITLVHAELLLCCSVNGKGAAWAAATAACHKQHNEDKEERGTRPYNDLPVSWWAHCVKRKEGRWGAQGVVHIPW